MQMKMCLKCKKIYTDDFAFCNICGYRLEQQKFSVTQNRNMMITIIIVFSVACVGIGFAVSEQKKISDTRKEIEYYKYKKSLKEYVDTPTIYDIRVNSDWTTDKSGDYIYIRGSVKNISHSKMISYFEVEAKFYDIYGNIIDSDWTNDGRDLAPGETRKFEIMHKCSSDEDNIKLSVTNLK